LIILKVSVVQIAAVANTRFQQIEHLLSEEKAQRARNWEYYETLRKTDPAKYWHPRTQVQMHRDSDALGKAFEPSEEDANG
jgi:hypothetical protein